MAKKKQRKCGECRKPGHTVKTCPKVKARESRAPRKASKASTKPRTPKKIDHVMGVRKSVDAALARYASLLPQDKLPDQVTVAESVLEYALEMLHAAHESAGLAWESILPRLVAVNSEWANEDRQELADLADDDDWDEDDEFEDEDDDPDEDDDEGIEYGSFEEAYEHNAKAHGTLLESPAPQGEPPARAPGSGVLGRRHDRERYARRPPSPRFGGLRALRGDRMVHRDTDPELAPFKLGEIPKPLKTKLQIDREDRVFLAALETILNELCEELIDRDLPLAREIVARVKSHGRDRGRLVQLAHRLDEEYGVGS